MYYVYVHIVIPLSLSLSLYIYIYYIHCLCAAAAWGLCVIAAMCCWASFLEFTHLKIVVGLYFQRHINVVLLKVFVCVPLMPARDSIKCVFAWHMAAPRQVHYVQK